MRGKELRIKSTDNKKAPTSWRLSFISPPKGGWGVYTMPCAIIAFATFMKPATLAPFT